MKNALNVIFNLSEYAAPKNIKADVFIMQIDTLVKDKISEIFEGNNTHSLQIKKVVNLIKRLVNAYETQWLKELALPKEVADLFSPKAPVKFYIWINPPQHLIIGLEVALRKNNLGIKCPIYKDKVTEFIDIF